MLPHPGLDIFRPLPIGPDALLTLLHLAQSAERSIDVMYYAWQPDLTGERLASAVLAAADRGVRVRVLLDDLGTGVDDNQVMALDAHPNLEIRLFNPIASRGTRLLATIGDFGRLNRRMHDKAFIADNQWTVVGGRNIGDNYFEASDVSNFGDLDVLAAGPIVHDVSAVFDLFWNASVVYPIAALTGKRRELVSLDALRAELAQLDGSERGRAYAEALRARADALLGSGLQDGYPGHGRLVFDDPLKITRSREDDEGHLLPQLAGLGVPLEHELTILSPYFIPGEEGVAWLTGLVRRGGVRVTVLTNSLASNDITSVYAAYRGYRDRLVDAGVAVYELRPSAFDVARRRHRRRRRIALGAAREDLLLRPPGGLHRSSLNLDPRSIRINTEIGIVCEEARRWPPTCWRASRSRLDRVAWRIGREADAAGIPRTVWVERDDGGTRKLAEEPEASVWKKIKVLLFGFLPIESEL